MAKMVFKKLDNTTFTCKPNGIKYALGFFSKPRRIELF